MDRKLWRLWSVLVLCFSGSALAQQTGSIAGKVTDPGGEGLPGVVITAGSNVLPRERANVTNASGNFRFSLLPPGDYILTITMSGFATAKRNAVVRLGQTTRLSVVLNAEVQESLTVVSQVPLVDTRSAELRSNVDNEVFEKIPIGQEYRDLVNLVPGVQVSPNSVRGPSAGGSGQDNLYRFDGVDVTLPLFGTLSSDPSTHDIDQISIVKGGAQAVGFNRAGGFLINSISKTGTNSYKGELNYRFQSKDWVADEKRPADTLVGEEEQTWLTFNFGGPLVKDRLFFYASYYAPETTLSDRSNAFGAQPDGKEDRDEYFLKFTFSPLDQLTIHASYRDQSTTFVSRNIGNLAASTLTRSDDSDQSIALVEADWVINETQSLSFKFTNFQLDTRGRPNRLLSENRQTTPGTVLPLDRLDQLGAVVLPVFRDDDPAYNDLVRPFIERYGFINANGVRTGGGTIGASANFDQNDFARTAFQLSYDLFLFSGNMEHQLHFGFSRTKDEEDLARSDQGWGTITFLSGTDEFIRAEFIRDAGSAPIHSEYHAENFEINDNITMGPWNFNLGVLLSHDELYGQDLTEDGSALSGFRLSPGSRYLMYEIDWDDLIQPRFGVVRKLRDQETVQANFAIYNPPATSLPRAASWARNRRNLKIRAFFDAQGNLVRIQERGSSSGKFFQPDMTPRQVQEILLGYSRTFGNGLTAKVTARQRKGSHFWEDTNNNARTRFAVTSRDEDPADIAARGDYIPELSTFRNEIGGSSYVIAELDGAFTKYYEATVDLEKTGENYYVKGTYSWSHYYGNFDQDNASFSNDQNIFIGSSFIADGVGRQLWDFKEGNLKGDRRHLVKLYGNYRLPWRSFVGVFAIYQSGEPWETTDVEFYREFTGSSSSSNRFAEPAGSRESDDHYQVDLNYQHEFELGSRVRLGLELDIFNLFNRQTGYAINPTASSPNFGVARSFWEPRRFRLAAGLKF